jgi:predicted GNAT family acetyltransferase
MSTQPVQPSAVVDNAQRQRYELAVDGSLVFADYQRQPGKVVITHVETPAALRGRGLAAVLMRGLVDEAGARGLQIVPVCSYAQDWMRHNKP